MNSGEPMTFWDHLDVLRSSLIKMGMAVVVFAVAAFLMKETLFSVVLAPRSSDFVTYRLLGVDAFSLHLMNTGLTEQFMIHMRTGCMRVCCWLHPIYYMSCSALCRQGSTKTNVAMRYGSWGRPT